MNSSYRSLILEDSEMKGFLVLVYHTSGPPWAWHREGPAPVSPVSFTQMYLMTVADRTVLESTRKLFQFDFQLMGWGGLDTVRQLGLL